MHIQSYTYMHTQSLTKPVLNTFSDKDLASFETMGSIFSKPLKEKIYTEP